MTQVPYDPRVRWYKIKNPDYSQKEGEKIRHFPLDAFERIIQINLIGTFRCIAKSAAGMLTLPPLDDGERGVIVNTASVAAQDGQMGQAAYSASKAGVVGLTLPVARARIVAARRRTRLPLRRHPRGMGWRRRRFPA
jgi:NAD(P)-dependent dehydrogenase (short-subunit alcohol dehydrogenase family)